MLGLRVVVGIFGAGVSRLLWLKGLLTVECSTMRARRIYPTRHKFVHNFMRVVHKAAMTAELSML